MDTSGSYNSPTPAIARARRAFEARLQRESAGRGGQPEAPVEDSRSS